MVQRVDYYTLLGRAVEALERDAYAARGVVYDREHKALLKRLISSSAPCSDADIAREERAFRDAVRRIEFPDDGGQAPRTPLREPVEQAWPNSAREKARALRHEFPQERAAEPERAAPSDARREGKRRRDAGYEETGRNPSGREIDLPSGKMQREEPGRNRGDRKSTFLVTLTTVYMLVAAVVLGAAGLGYGFLVGAIDLPRLTPAAAPPSQRAILYEGGQSARTAKSFEGTAIWRTRTEPSSPGGKPDL